jgi:hypothetical protein
MPAPQILRNGQMLNGPSSVGRIHVSEPTQAGVLTVKDGTTVVATMSWGGPGTLEPAAIIFNPAKSFATGVHIANTMGGNVHVYVQGASGFGG